MGYKIVAVSPLKSFPIASLKLANVVSVNDAQKQVFEKYRKMAQMRIDSEDAQVSMLDVAGGQKLNADGRAEIFGDYEKVAEKEFKKFEEERWPKIEPELETYLERQKRRQKHFESACRMEGCDNPHRQKRVRGLATGTKSRRPGVRPLFCGVHVGLRKLLTKEALDQLYKSSANRVRIV